ncbi:tyrosine-type recombinase/integrase [Rodentibacter trehalosifermentans]|uniref:tyrosine-type recombinase/integrase n=1 Tax=Rodentibacter trehalosifermentans TaxID=1908263 RepID=UPI0009D04BC9|nr:site-specific integrase [Rodentibacter trehalosifermentans]OOF48724.1 integrase [Rodentibacter trehalosifermentans]
MRQLQNNCNLKYPDEVSELELLQWRKRVVGKTIIEVTWNSYIRQLKTIFKFGIERKVLPFTQNPFNALFIREGKRKRKTYTFSDLERLSFGIKESKYLPDILRPAWFIEALIMTFRYTAIRRAQLNKLRIQNVDLVNRVIHISPEINKNHDHHVLPISTALYPYLDKLINELKKLKQPEDAQLFNINLFSGAVKRKGKEMTADQVSYIFKVISKYTGVTSSPHRFRHAAATNLMKNPENLYIAKQLLGHKDVKVTLTYIEDDIESIREYTNLL